jgi:hypothetical protein
MRYSKSSGLKDDLLKLGTFRLTVSPNEVTLFLVSKPVPRMSGSPKSSVKFQAHAAPWIPPLSHLDLAACVCSRHS